MTLTQIKRAGLDGDALDRVFTIGASGSSAYTFQGEGLNGTVNNPTLYLTRGKTYRFENGSGGHPIRIQSTSGASGTAYNTGVTNNAGSGTVIVEVQHDAPDVLYYQCTSHAAMNGILYITGALADGGVTTAKIAANAVTTPKILDSAVSEAKLGSSVVTTAKLADGSVTQAKLASTSVTTAKIAAGAVTSAELGTNAVNTTKIADDAVTIAKLADDAVGTTQIADQAVTLAKLPHGTSSNDGKFLRANNGADPTFETVTGTTINNNANNRLITGSGTANTLEGEANLTFDGDDLLLKSSTDGRRISFATDGSSHYMKYDNTLSGIILNGYGGIAFETNGTNERMRIDSSGRLMIGTSTEGFGTADDLTIASSADTGITIRSGTTNQGNIFFSDATSGTGEFSGIIQYTHGTGTGEHLRLFVQSAEKVRIDSDGLKLNGDTAAANAFDDYEEGTFTLSPSSGGFSGVAGTGRYTKIGRTVIFNIDCSLQGSGNSSVFRLDGLPFVSWDWNSCSGYFQYYSNEGGQQACFAIPGNTNDIGVIEFGNEMAGSTTQAGYVNIAGCYQTT